MRTSLKSEICLVLVCVFILGGFGTSGCKRERELQPLTTMDILQPSLINVTTRFCTQPASEIRQKLKYIFIVDKSSSNQQPPSATDPLGFRRYSPLSQFIANSQDDPGYTYYSLIDFSDGANVVQGFTDNRTTFQSVIQQEWNRNGPHAPRDQGFTDYLSALDSATNLIKTDVTAAKNLAGTSPVASIYMIIFISDGYPIVANSSSATGTLPQVYEPDVKTKLNTLLQLKTDVNYRAYIDEIVLHTGYYFEERDEDAEVLLSAMAAQGGGDSHQFGAGKNIDFQLFAVPVRRVKYQLREVFVENASVTWWTGDKLLPDSDRDGLPDEIENQLHSNPKLADSDGNGVSDLVEYRTKGRPCLSPTCSSALAERDNYAACTGLLPDTGPDGSSNSSPGGTLVFDDVDHDGLNDCEEWILRSKRDSFDSNSDYIPDFLSLKNRIPFVEGTNGTTSDPDSDGLTSYFELKAGLPPSLPNATLHGAQPMTYSLSLDGGGGELDCYQLKVSDVTVMGIGNVIRVYLIQNTAMINNKPILKIAQGSVAPGATDITFSQGDFK